jgi:hypothetical protein
MPLNISTLSYSIFISLIIQEYPLIFYI